METALSSIGQIIWRWLDMHGLDAEALFAAQGVDKRILGDPSARVPTAVWDAV